MVYGKIAPPVEIHPYVEVRKVRHTSSADIGHDNALSGTRNFLTKNPSNHSASWEKQRGFRDEKCFDLILRQITFSSTLEGMPLSWSKNAHQISRRNTFRSMASYSNSGMDLGKIPSSSWAVNNTQAVLRIGSRQSLRPMASHSENHVDSKESPPSWVFDDTHAAFSEKKKQLLESTEPLRNGVEETMDDYDDFIGFTPKHKQTKRKIQLLGGQTQVTPFGGDIMDKGIRVNNHFTEHKSAIEQEAHNKILRPLVIKATELGIKSTEVDISIQEQVETSKKATQTRKNKESLAKQTRKDKKSIAKQTKKDKESDERVKCLILQQENLK